MLLDLGGHHSPGFDRGLGVADVLEGRWRIRFAALRLSFRRLGSVGSGR